MTDAREDILARLEAIAGTVTGIKKVFRNETTTNETDLPAIIVLDADEKADPTDPEGRGPLAPRRMIMTPQLFIVLPEGSETVGTALNGFRASLIKKIATDDELIALTPNHRGARLVATQTSLAWGRSMMGEMGVSFAIPYIVFPDQLT